jgi:hypothetical protein
MRLIGEKEKGGGGVDNFPVPETKKATGNSNSDGFFLHSNSLRGETGIRTQGTLLAYTHFPGVLLRPLGHLSRGQ